MACAPVPIMPSRQLQNSQVLLHPPFESDLVSYGDVFWLPVLLYCMGFHDVLLVSLLVPFSPCLFVKGCQILIPAAGTVFFRPMRQPVPSVRQWWVLVRKPFCGTKGSFVAAVQPTAPPQTVLGVCSTSKSLFTV